MVIEFDKGCAVITGGTSGIGLALARAIAAAGMSTVLVGRDPERAATAAEAVRAHGADVLAITCDVGDRAAVADLVARVRDEVGPVELLALNAGVTTAGPLLDHVPEDWDWVFGSVLHGVVNGIQSFVPAMVERARGHVLITASMVGLVPDYFLLHGPYAAAKAAVIGLGVALRAELRATGVGLSILVPAGTETGLPDSHVGRPAITTGRIAAADAPHPIDTVLPRPDAPALEREFRFLPTDDVALRTLDGLARDELFIITHPEFRPVFEDYSHRILQAFDDGRSWERGRP